MSDDDESLLERKLARQNRVRNHIRKYNPGRTGRKIPIEFRTALLERPAFLQVIVRRQHEPVIWRHILEGKSKPAEVPIARRRIVAIAVSCEKARNPASAAISFAMVSNVSDITRHRD